jgi:uncharacterized cupredoxin-like copper-binding protein
MRNAATVRKRTAAAVIALALTAALLLSACGGGDEADPAAERPAGEPAAQSPAEPASPPASEPSDAAPAREVTVRIGEMFFKPNQRRLKAGKVTVNARNVGDAEHDIVMVKTDLPAGEMPMTPEGGPDYEQAGHVMFGGHGGGGHGTEDGGDIHVMPGETERMHVTLEPGRYALVCSLPGHYQAGQHASLKVVG